MEDRKEHFIRPTFNRPPSLVNLTFLAVVFGILAGLGGYLLGKTLLPTQLNFLTTQPDIRINLEQPLTDAASKNQKSVAGIYRALKSVGLVSQPVFTTADQIGTAAVVTSDGWLLTTDQVPVTLQNLVVLNDEIYNIKDIKADKFSGAIFIKVTASGLTPVNFQLADSVKQGETLFTEFDLPNSMDNMFEADVLGSSHYVSAPYLSTEAVDYYLQLATPVPSKDFKAGLPYFNLKGDIVGITYLVDQEPVLIPAEYLRQAVRHLLDNTTRPVWGISTYLDLDNNSGFIERGDLVTATPAKTTVAGKADLRAGDRILAVNNDTVSKDRTVTSILQNYRVGDRVVLKVFRNTSEIDIELK